MGYFGDFLDFKEPIQAKNALFPKNEKIAWRYSPDELRNPESSSDDQPPSRNLRAKPPINGLYTAI